MLLYLRKLAAAGALDQAQVQTIDERVRREMAAAVRFALDSPFPAPGEAYKHVFAQAGATR